MSHPYYGSMRFFLGGGLAVERSRAVRSKTFDGRTPWGMVNPWDVRKHKRRRVDDTDDASARLSSALPAFRGGRGGAGGGYHLQNGLSSHAFSPGGRKNAAALKEQEAAAKKKKEAEKKVELTEEEEELMKGLRKYLREKHIK